MSTAVTRHTLVEHLCKVRWLPGSAPGPPDLDGRQQYHKLLCIGSYDEEMEANVLSFMDLHVQSRGSSQITNQLDSVVNYMHPGTLTAMQVTELDGNEVMVAIATCEGAIFLLRLMIPRAPGSGPADVQMLSVSVKDDILQPWLSPHRGAVTAVDVHPTSKNVLTAGVDGSVFVFDPEHVSGSSTAPFSSSAAGCTSYSCAAWRDSHQFVSACNLGGLQLWDMRAGQGPVSSPPSQWGRTGCPQAPCVGPLPPSIHSLAVHPSQPNLCATGNSNGGVTLWDLRLTQQPLAYLPEDGTAAGPVWEVKFDVREQFASSSSSSMPSILHCCEGGRLARTHAPIASAPAPPPNGLHSSFANGFGGTGNNATGLGARHGSASAMLGSSVIAAEDGGGYASICSFDVEPGLGQELVYCTDTQALVHVVRAGGAL